MLTMLLLLFLLSFTYTAETFSSPNWIHRINARDNWEYQPIDELNPVKWNIDPRGRHNPVPVNEVLRLLYSSNFPTAVASNISLQCVEDSQRYALAVTQQVKWALMMYESTGQFPEGYIGGGNVHAVGLFDECLSISTALHANTNRESDFRGQYCTVFFHVEPVSEDELATTDEDAPQDRAENWLLLYQLYQLLYNESTPLKFPKVRDTDTNSRFLPSVGLCLPSSCSAEDVRSACAQQVGSATLRANVSVVTISDESYCYTEAKVNQPPNFDAADIVVIVLLSVLGFVVMVATCHEAYRLHYVQKPIDVKTEGLVVRSLFCFSALTNAKTLLNTTVNNQDNISCLNGIRVLTTTWVIMGHIWRWLSTRSNTIYNQNQLYDDLYGKWTWQVVTYNSVCVDTFFLMSGCLVAASLLRELDRNNGRFSVFFFYLHRFLRLTVVYAVILGFVATLLSHLGTGPEWENARTLSEACRSDWWQNLLYINNYFIADNDTLNHICMSESWYLAADMQMFWISPIFIYPLWKWKRLGLGWTIFSTIVLLVACLAVYIIWDLPPSFNIPNTPRNVLYDTSYYQETWVHLPPYIVGILLALLLQHSKRQNVKLTKVQVSLGWALSTAMGLAAVYGMVPYLGDESIPDFPRVAFGALHRFVWAIAVSWVVFACTRGYGGYINDILSWKAFTVLGRITYVVYLVHYNFLAIYYAHVRKPDYYTALSRVVFFLGVVMLVFLVSFIISLTIELPFLNLEKIYIVNPSSQRKKKIVNPVTIENGATDAT